MESKNPISLFEQLIQEGIYQKWSKINKKTYLSHFFCQLDNKFQVKTNWEIGFFNPSDQKITIFAPLQKKSFEIKPADDVFKEKSTIVEKLDFKKVKNTSDQALQKMKNCLKENYSKETLGDGFMILQKLNGKNIWNITFVTKSLVFLNIKIDTFNGNIISHEKINFIDKNKFSDKS